MSEIDRRLLRIACRVQAAYDARRCDRRFLDLPEREWDAVRAMHARRQAACDHGYSAAAARLRERLVGELEDLTRQLRNRTASLQVPERRALPSLRDLYADLQALAIEFADLQLDGPVVAVTTEPIALAGIELGRFQIRLELDRLDAGLPYAITALEPNPAVSNAETTHPHVHDSRLCPGDGRAAIQAALAAGRLLDFFVLVDRVLQNYSEGSAYVELADWYGSPCHDCGDTVSEDAGTTCFGCEERLCDDCYVVCGGCSESCCAGCSDRCGRCDEYACNGCLGRCDHCRRDVCAACREDGRCETCREELLAEESADDPANSASGGRPARSEPAV